MDESKNGCSCGNGCCGGGATARTIGRRRLLGWMVGILNAAAGIAVIGPVVGFVISPVRAEKKRAHWISLLEETDLQDGETRLVTYTQEVEDGYMMAERKTNVFISRRGTSVIAHDPTCPHLGCHVEYRAKKRRYICPCHGGVFDDDGNRVSGPPPRGLTQVETRIENGKIWIRTQA